MHYFSAALHSGDVFPGEGIGGVADQQTGLTNSTVGERGRERERERESLKTRKTKGQ